MNEKKMIENFVQLIRRASTDLPRDIEKALESAGRRESGVAGQAVGVILENIRLARRDSVPLCQDTGLHTWTVHHPFTWDAEKIRSWILEATVRATSAGLLRPNAVDPVTGANSGNNTGIAHPMIELAAWKRNYLTAGLLLKGGGSENVSSQVSLPDTGIGAGRDIEGVKRAALKIVLAAQGRGCAPGIVGLCAGGDRQTGYRIAKAQLKRPLDDRNPDPALARLEKSILEAANALGIGPMGFGGKTTLLGVKAARAARHPACYFVTVAYGCWALRRWNLKIDAGGRLPVFSQKPFNG
ncbi:MAG: fumarate hydratase [Pseudomonadota bacterium]